MLCPQTRHCIAIFCYGMLWFLHWHVTLHEGLSSAHFCTIMAHHGTPWGHAANESQRQRKWSAAVLRSLAGPIRWPEPNGRYGRHPIGRSSRSMFSVSFLCLSPRFEQLGQPLTWFSIFFNVMGSIPLGVTQCPVSGKRTSGLWSQPQIVSKERPPWRTSWSWEDRSFATKGSWVAREPPAATEAICWGVLHPGSW